jgi:hypothetical protein
MLMTIKNYAKSVPADLKREIRKEFNGPNHAAVYAKLEAYLGEQFCVYEDGTIYAVAKSIAGVC